VTEESQQFQWPGASATGIGSMPGTDPAEVCRTVFGELPDLPFLPELPARGPGADIIGRTAALLVDMPVQMTISGWKLADRPGREASRSAGFLSHDLDTLEEVAEGFAGALKVQACGPLTLAAALELTHRLDPALSDQGALAELTVSLAEGLAAHVADVRRRVPAAAVVLQLDEPSLPAALAGRVPTASGLNVVRALEPMTAIQRLAAVLAAAGAAGAAATAVHCCAGEVPFREIAAAGAGAVSFDLASLRDADVDLVAELAEAGVVLMVGALPTAAVPRLATGPPRPARQTAADVAELWHKTGLAAGQLASEVVITPGCGLAGVSPAAASAALAHCREAARIAPEMIEPS
jgi:methionine synthase II (cobalamin-independent)